MLRIIQTMEELKKPEFYPGLLIYTVKYRLSYPVEKEYIPDTPLRYYFLRLVVNKPEEAANALTILEALPLVIMEVEGAIITRMVQATGRVDFIFSGAVDRTSKGWQLEPTAWAYKSDSKNYTLRISTVVPKE